MKTSTLTAIIVMTLLLVSASAGGALAATVSLQGQQSPTGTSGTATNDSATTVGVANQSDGPGIIFNNQQMSSQSVLIQSVTISQPGFIVIYDSSRSGNETDQIIGSFHLLGSGTFQNILVPLETSMNQSTSLTAIIHHDTNSNGRFDYVSSNGTQDRPLTPQGDRRIVDIAQVTTPNSSDSGGATSSGNNSGTAVNSGMQTASGGDGGTTDTSRGGEGGQQGTEVGGPGFGLVVGIVALLSVALLTVRRT